MDRPIPNLQLRAWRNSNNLTGAEMANNGTPTGGAERLECDEERIRRWEVGEVRWPRSHYRKALRELTGRDARSLGFAPASAADEVPVLAGEIVPRDAMKAEATLFDTMELPIACRHPMSGRAPWRRSRRPSTCSAAPTR